MQIQPPYEIPHIPKEAKWIEVPPYTIGAKTERYVNWAWEEWDKRQSKKEKETLLSNVCAHVAYSLDTTKNCTYHHRCRKLIALRNEMCNLLQMRPIPLADMLTER